MAEFRVVRYENSTDTPIVDGQVLVDMQTTAMSFDINGERKYSNYVFGVHVQVHAYEWYKDEPLDGKYYLDFNDIGPSDESVIPEGYSLSSVIFNTGQESITGTRYIYADEPLNGTALLMFTPDSSLAGSSATSTSPKRLVLFHLDASDDYLYIDTAGMANITATGCSYVLDNSKFGAGSLLKSSAGSINTDASVFYDPTVAFTIEWWEKAAVDSYSGEIRLRVNSDIYTVPAAPVGSKRRNPNVWHHVAITHTSNDTSMIVYVDGKMTAVFEYVDYDVEITDFTIMSNTGHVVYMSELAFFNYNKYKKEFIPSDIPYVGFAEPSIVVNGDMVAQNMRDMGQAVIDIPATIKTYFGEVLPASDITIVDTGTHNKPVRVNQIDGRVYVSPTDIFFTEDLELTVYATYPGALSKPIKVKIFLGTATYPDSEQSGGGSVDLGPIEERLDTLEGSVNDKLDSSEFDEFYNNNYSVFSTGISNRVTALENKPSGGGTSEVTVSGTTPTISALQPNTVYVCTSTITKLTVSSIANGHDDATIIFTTGSSFTASFPSSLKWISNTSFKTNATYMLSVCSNIAVASEVVSG